MNVCLVFQTASQGRRARRRTHAHTEESNMNAGRSSISELNNFVGLFYQGKWTKFSFWDAQECTSRPVVNDPCYFLDIAENGLFEFSPSSKLRFQGDASAGEPGKNAGLLCYRFGRTVRLLLGWIT